MRRALISAPVLAFPDFNEQFLLYVDASSTGIGFALAQVRDGKEVAIAYNERGLNQAERNYSTTERSSRLFFPPLAPSFGIWSIRLCMHSNTVAFQTKLANQAH